MIIKCAVVDDEPLAVELLASYVKKIPFLELCGKYTNATDALHGIGEQPVDLLFLDIQMPELNGLELSRMVPENTRIVFTTAFNQYAVDGFRVNALDYLLKPISYADFLEACNKAMQWFQLADLTTAMAALYRVIEKVDAFFPYHALDLVVVRKEYLYLNAILHVCAVDELIGIGKETARVEGKDACCGRFFDNDVCEHLILDAQTGRQSDASLVVFQEIAKHLFSTLPFQLSIKACD